MPFIPRKGKVQSLTYSASTLTTRELPRRALRGLGLNLTVVHTNGAGPSITWESLTKLIDRVGVVINGQDTLLQIPFWMLYVMNYYDYSIAPPVSISSTPSTTVTSTAALTLPFELTRALVPMDTVLDARGVSRIDLDVNWGSSIGTGVTSVDSAILGINTDEYVGVDPGKALQAGRHEFAYTLETLSGTGQYEMRLETEGQNQYRRLFLATRNSSGSLSPYPVTNVKVKSGATYYFDQSTSDISRDNQVEYSQSPLSGIYIVDFTRSGKMTQRLDARNLSELVLELNVGATGSIEVLKEKVIFA